MKLEQVSVFIENQPGRMVAMLEALRSEGVNIRALSIAETADFGITRMILSDVEKGVEALGRAGFPARTTEVLRVEVPDVPGGLLEGVAKPLAAAGINVEYMYAFIDPAPGKAVVVVKVGDLERAEKAVGLA